MSQTRSKSAGSTVATVAVGGRMPALATTASRLPKRSTAAAVTSSIAPASRTSSSHHAARSPSSPASASRRSGSSPARATSSPRATSWRAVSAPMPRAAPVIRTVRPLIAASRSSRVVLDELPDLLDRPLRILLHHAAQLRVGRHLVGDYDARERAEPEEYGQSQGDAPQAPAAS